MSARAYTFQKRRNGIVTTYTDHWCFYQVVYLLDYGRKTSSGLLAMTERRFHLKTACGLADAYTLLLIN